MGSWDMGAGVGVGAGAMLGVGPSTEVMDVIDASRISMEGCSKV